MLWTLQQNPWNEFDKLSREIDSIFNGQARAKKSVGNAAVNVWKADDKAIVTVKAPGLKLEDIEIESKGRVLTIKAERKAEELNEGEQYIRKARQVGKFERSIEFDFDFKRQAIEAVYKNGILQITLPKADAEKELKIEVKAG